MANIVQIDNYLSSSSSDEGSDDEERALQVFVNAIVNNNNRDERGYRRIPRVKNYVETVIFRYNIEEFRKTFRQRIENL